MQEWNSHLLRREKLRVKDIWGKIYKVQFCMKLAILRCFWDLQAEVYGRWCKPCQGADKATKGGWWEPTSRNRIMGDSSSPRSACWDGQKGDLGGRRWVEDQSTLWVPETIQRCPKKRQHFHKERACFVLTSLIYFFSTSELYPEPWGQLRGHKLLFCSIQFWDWVDSFLKINSN